MAASASQSVVVTASVGVAISDGLTDTELLAYADLAMYEAKEAGRKKTVAEFVSDQESTSLLRTIGVDCAQGYYIGEPRLITEALRLMPPWVRASNAPEAEPST